VQTFSGITEIIGAEVAIIQHTQLIKYTLAIHAYIIRAGIIIIAGYIQV